MMHNAPGKHFREGISLVALMDMFPDDNAAREWFENTIWPNGPFCPFCKSTNIQCKAVHKSQTHRCRDCKGKPRFSVRTNTVMQGSRLGYRLWAIAIYLYLTGIDGVSSMKLHRDLDITQKTAWFLAHRLRKAFEGGDFKLVGGPVEAKECFTRDKECSIHTDKKLKAARRIYHHMSKKHLQRYAAEFAGRRNIRNLGTWDQMATIAVNMIDKRLEYKELIT